MSNVIIVGGGPAGVSCAIYLKRANVDVSVIEKSFIGGQVGRTSELENYAGFVGQDAFQFCENLKKQLATFEIPVIRDTVIQIDGANKKIIGKKGTYTAKAIILCLGADEISLDLPNIQNFVGSGVSYCAVCDGNFYKNKDVCVVGGGNTAIEDAIYLSKLANKVHIIHRRNEYRAEPYLIQSLEYEISKNADKIIQHKDSFVSKIIGENKVEAVEITNVNTQEKSIINVDGVFLCIGRKPKLDFLRGEFEITESGYIKTNERFETNVKGIFAGGDCIEKDVRQVVTAVSDGAMISKYVLKYLLDENNEK